MDSKEVETIVARIRAAFGGWLGVQSVDRGKDGRYRIRVGVGAIGDRQELTLWTPREFVNLVWRRYGP